MMANQNPDGTNIDGGRGGVCKTQRGGGQGVESNKGASALDIPGELVPSIQTDGNTENREVQRYGFKTGKRIVPTSTAGGQTENIPRRRRSH